MKNLNSPRFLAQAIEHESRRQILELEAGREIVQETRLWDSDKKESRSMRGKEEAHDYRYFPDPDLPPLILKQDEVDKVRGELPELPYEKRKRFVEELGISRQDALVLTEEKAIADYFEEALQSGAQAKGVANWIINELLRAVKEQDEGSDEESGAIQFPISAPSLGALVLLIDKGTITGKIAKKVFAAMLEGEGEDPNAIVQAKGWQVERDEGAIKAAVDEVLAANPKQVEQYRGGKAQLLGFFVGQIMKATRGKADPAEVNRLLKEKLGGE
jgi:aspartyl-tRNA(Asn)/glutamyl-tRNA(Gln) amidotransferase subunit B